MLKLLELLELARRGDLGLFDPVWGDWIIRHGLLISPEGWEATPGQIRATRLHEATLAAYRTENRNLRAALEELESGQIEDQPLPEQWEVSVG